MYNTNKAIDYIWMESIKWDPHCICIINFWLNVFKFVLTFSPTKRPCPSPNGSNEDLTSLPEKDVPKVSNRRNIKLQSLIDLRRRVSEEGHPALRDLV